MSWWQTFRSNYKQVYGLPRWQGLIMGAVIALAVRYAIFNGSVAEQWTALAMFMFTVLHLLEASSPIRHIEVRFVQDDAAFAGEEHGLRLHVIYQGSDPLAQLRLDLKGSNPVWIGPLQPFRVQEVRLPVLFSRPGRQALPRVRVQDLSSSPLFQFWRIFIAPRPYLVLPEPRDHQLSAQNLAQSGTDYEIKELDLIRDPRLLHKVDLKLLQKTGQPYWRVMESIEPQNQLRLFWQDLAPLTAKARAEQFSFWLRSLEKNAGLALLAAPFSSKHTIGSPQELKQLKRDFAEWLYD